jgi:N-acyl-L-homoserine lactone synthetase
MDQVFYSSSHGIPDAVLRNMFEARKSVFVDLLKWDVPVLDGRFEIDQFDDEHAVYLVLANCRGAHLASARLLQTTRPHILGNIFASLCEGEPPRAHDIFEITRFCLDRSLSKSWHLAGAALRSACRRRQKGHSSRHLRSKSITRPRPCSRRLASARSLHPLATTHASQPDRR